MTIVPDEGAPILPPVGQSAPQAPGALMPDAGAEVLPPQQTGGLESFARGALQGATFGLSDEISGALESLFTDKTYVQARDESRTANTVAEESHPYLSMAGNVAGSLPQMAVPGLNVAKGASIGKAALNMGAQGAAAGFGGSNASLVGPNADAGAVAGDTAIGGILGAGIGALAHGAGKVLSKAPEAAAVDRASAVLEGEGVNGRAGASAAKRLSRDVEGVDDVLTQKFKGEVDGKVKTLSLDEVMRSPAAEVKPIIAERLEQVASKLDPVYDAFEKKTGGLNLADFANHVQEETAKLAQSPLNEGRIKALNDVLESVSESWGKGADPGDVNVPFRKFRELVTNLQSKVPGEAPTEALQIKQDTARNLKEFLNTRLETLAEDHPELEGHFKELMKTNREIAALSSVRDAVDQRAWKEATGGTSAKGHIAKFVGNGVGAGVGGMIGGPVGAGVGAVVGGAVANSAQATATKVRSAALRQLEHASQRMKELETAAAGGNQHAAILLRVIQGTPEIATKLAALHAGAK